MSAGETFAANSIGGSTKISVDQMPEHGHGIQYLVGSGGNANGGYS